MSNFKLYNILRKKSNYIGCVKFLENEALIFGLAIWVESVIIFVVRVGCAVSKA